MPGRLNSCSLTGKSSSICRMSCLGLIPPTVPTVFTKTWLCRLCNGASNGNWTLRLKTAPENLIGSISLLLGENKNRGFWLGLPWHGQGLMSEATEVVTDYWFNVLNFKVLRAPKAIVNEASRRISAKNGMRVIATEEREYVSGKLLTEIWEIRPRNGTLGISPQSAESYLIPPSNLFTLVRAGYIICLHW
jgi:RimJ/RimL family protein N-acetyltransferase